ncbi:hypothetical protein R0J93_26535, partial [Pseudoalteromonas sp. SIMBA_148]
INIRAVEMTVDDFIRYVEAASGYELTLTKNNTLLGESFVSKQFNLAAFASNRYSRSDVSTRSSSSANFSAVEGEGNDGESTGA